MSGETAFGRSVDAYLKLLGCVVVRVNSGGMKVQGKDGKERYVPFNSAKGCSDRIVCLPGGRFLALELKQGKNKPTAEQMGFLDAVGASGGLGLCVWDMDQLIETMKDLGYDKS